MFRERKFIRKILRRIRNNEYTNQEIVELLLVIPIEVLRKIAKEIIYADYDGYNGFDKYSKMCYFDSLSRWQKELYIQERLYKLY